MTLSDCKAEFSGVVVGMRGDAEVHRRLVDMGVPGSECYVRAVRGGSTLVCFGGEFSVVTAASVASQIEVARRYENRALRKSERR